VIVIFDANIWISHLYANAPLRASALLYLHRKGATVALPEVVRLEVEVHLRSRLRDFRDKSRDNYNTLLKVFGRMKEAVFPSDADIDGVVDRFFSDSGFTFREIPFTLESAKDSFRRTINKVRPSHRSQQFKDGVIWADCIRLADEAPVLLIAGDKAFYRDDQLKNGIAAELSEEAGKTTHGVRILPSIYDFIDEVREPLVFDQQELIELAKSMPLWAEIQRYCFANDLTPTTERLAYDVFATEIPHVVALKCDLRLPCVDETDAERTNAEGFVTFDCQRQVVDGEIDHISPSSLGVRWIAADGETVERRHAYFYADGGVFGHADAVNRFREPLL
jgi:hypothetical protein